MRTVIEYFLLHPQRLLYARHRLLDEDENDGHEDSFEQLVRIGRKPPMSYVTACVTMFNSGKDAIVIRARGRAIEKAIDVVHMLRRGFVKDAAIANVLISSEQLTRPDGHIGTVSIIEITLDKSFDPEEG